MAPPSPAGFRWAHENTTRPNSQQESLEQPHQRGGGRSESSGSRSMDMSSADSVGDCRPEEPEESLQDVLNFPRRYSTRLHTTFPPREVQSTAFSRLSCLKSVNEAQEASTPHISPSPTTTLADSSSASEGGISLLLICEPDCQRRCCATPNRGAGIPESSIQLLSQGPSTPVLPSPCTQHPIPTLAHICQIDCKHPHYLGSDCLEARYFSEPCPRNDDSERHDSPQPYFGERQPLFRKPKSRDSWSSSSDTSSSYTLVWSEGLDTSDGHPLDAPVDISIPRKRTSRFFPIEEIGSERQCRAESLLGSSNINELHSSSTPLPSSTPSQSQRSDQHVSAWVQDIEPGTPSEDDGHDEIWSGGLNIYTGECALVCPTWHFSDSLGEFPEQKQDHDQSQEDFEPYEETQYFMTSVCKLRGGSGVDGFDLGWGEFEFAHACP